MCAFVFHLRNRFLTAHQTSFDCNLNAFIMFKKMRPIFLFNTLFLGHLLVDVMIHFCSADLRRGYSLLQRGQRLEKRLITNLGGISFLDCVEECLRRTRCLSVNYFQPAHFCEVNYKKKESLPEFYFVKAGWYYSERDDWDKVFCHYFLNGQINSGF